MHASLEVFKVTNDPDDLNTYKEDRVQYKKVLDEVSTHRMEKRKAESSEEDKALYDIYLKLVGQVPIKKQKVNTDKKIETVSELDSGISSIESSPKKKLEIISVIFIVTVKINIFCQHIIFL